MQHPWQPAADAAGDQRDMATAITRLEIAFMCLPPKGEEFRPKWRTDGVRPGCGSGRGFGRRRQGAGGSDGSKSPECGKLHLIRAWSGKPGVGGQYGGKLSGGTGGQRTRALCSGRRDVTRGVGAAATGRQRFHGRRGPARDGEGEENGGEKRSHNSESKVKRVALQPEPRVARSRGAETHGGRSGGDQRLVNRRWPRGGLPAHRARCGGGRVPGG